MKELPDGFRTTASNETCQIQAMQQKGRRLYGVQFHPELFDEQHRKASRSSKTSYDSKSTLPVTASINSSVDVTVSIFSKSQYFTNYTALVVNFLTKITPVSRLKVVQTVC